MRIQNFKIQKRVDNNAVVLYPTLIEVNGRNYLIDCGYEETYEEFIEGLAVLGVGISDLHAILISHDDIDHIGALKLFKDANPDLMVYCSQTEERSISGKEKSERLMQAESNLPMMDDAYKPWAVKFINQLNGIKRIPVDMTLKDGDKIENEIQTISTPGHTKGHISFYVPSHKTLIASDALVIDADNFDLANPQFTLDPRQAIKSVQRIREVRAERIVCYHGGIVEESIHERLTRLINKYTKEFEILIEDK